MRSSILKVLRQAAALFLVYALPVTMFPGGALGQTTAPASDTSVAMIPPDQLDSLVAPIALYPDPLLAQVLAASTYPLEIIQLQQWMDKNKSLTGQALSNAVMQQNWDPSVQAMAPLPDVLKVLSENIKWTTDLGNAFLAQQNDVMDAVQRMRLKAQGKGQLQTTPQQTVETKVVESKTVVVIEPSSPDVVYVPSYDPMVVYGAPAYPYPPVYYPGYVAGAAIAFGTGLAIGAAWGHGGWGWNCGWGGGNNNININNNNNFINNSNRQNINRPGAGGSGTQWQHNPQHRGGTPYGNRDTANKFGGTTRGDSMANRQATARQNVGQMGNQGQFGNRQQGGFQGSGGPGGAGGGDRVGSRDVSRGSGSGAFGGASSGMSGRDARASQSRGSSSMSSRGGGGGGSSRSGGGRSGGGRSGGGGGRRR